MFRTPVLFIAAPPQALEETILLVSEYFWHALILHWVKLNNSHNIMFKWIFNKPTRTVIRVQGYPPLPLLTFEQIKIYKWVSSMLIGGGFEASDNIFSICPSMEVRWRWWEEMIATKDLNTTPFGMVLRFQGINNRIRIAQSRVL